MQTLKTKGGAAKTLMLGTAVALALVGCGDKDEATATGEVKDFKVAMMDGGDLDAYFEVDSRTVSAAQGEAGLAAMGLLEKSDKVTWASRSGDNGDYTFDELVFTGDDGESVKIDSLELTGLREIGGDLGLDKLVAEDTVISPPEAEGEMRIELIRLVEPDMDDVAAFLDGDSGVDMPTARAFSVSGVSGNLNDDATEGTVTVKHVAFSKPRGDRKDGFFLVDDVDIDIVDSEDGTPMPITMNVDDIAIMGIADDMIFDGDFQALMTRPTVSADEMLYRSMLVEDVSVTADTLVFDVESIKIDSDIDGEIVTSRVLMAPVRIGFTGVPTEPDLVGMYEGMQQIGLDELVMTAGGDGIMDFAEDRVATDNFYMDFKDLMRMEFAYDLDGFVAMSKAQADAMAALGDEPDYDEDPDAYFEYQMKQAEVGMAGLDNLAIDNFEIVLDDNSIMDKIFTQVAEQQGTTAKALRMQTKGMLAMGTMMAGETGIDPEVISDLIAALGEFIDNPGSKLVVAVDPDSAIPAASFQGLDKAGMGFSATVEK